MISKKANQIHGASGMFTLIRALFLVGLLVCSNALSADEFPNRTIKFVVPFPAGGPADTMSRVLTEKMASLLGQPVVIENHSGAGGLNGITQVAKSNPDGYTIAIAPSSNLAMMVNLRDSMPFQLKDLALITQIVSVPEILVINQNVSAKTLAEFVALAKAQPGKLPFASTGVGGMPPIMPSSRRMLPLLQAKAQRWSATLGSQGTVGGRRRQVGQRVGVRSIPRSC